MLLPIPFGTEILYFLEVRVKHRTTFIVPLCGLRHWIWRNIGPAPIVRRSVPRYATPGPPPRPCNFAFPESPDPAWSTCFLDVVHNMNNGQLKEMGSRALVLEAHLSCRHDATLRTCLFQASSVPKFEPEIPIHTSQASADSTR